MHEANSALNRTTPETVPAGAPRNAVETALKSVIDLYGPSLLYEADYLKNFLEEECPDATREISILLLALDKQVPQDLLGAHTDEELESVLPRLAKRLSDQKILASGASNWAVQTWARVLGLSSAATGAPPDSLYGDVDASSVTNEPSEIPVPNPDGDSSRLANLAPPQVHPKPEGWLSRPSSRWLAIVAALLTVIVAGIAIWFGSLHYALAITHVASGEPLIGDGKARDVFVSFTSSRIEVRGVQIRFVRGDGKLASQPLLIDVSPEAAAQGRAPAGRIGLHTTKPATATFEYVLVAAGGKRSAPFEKTFEIAPVPAVPPVITAIAAPHPILAGKPFMLTIVYKSGEGSVARIERKVIDSTVKWPSEETVTDTPELHGQKSGALSYPFEAIETPLQGTIEFTLVDGDGVRSEPKRIVLDVVQPPARVASHGCTNATCGRVVAVREIDQKADDTGFRATIERAFGRFSGRPTARRQKTYAVTIRTDNGKVRVIRQTTLWRSGARVRVVGNRITTVDS